jgi:DNA-directed RNA polymerase subunit omega
MARVTVEDCIDKVESPYELVLVAKERAVQLNSGLEPTLDRDDDKNTVISLREIALETIKVPDLTESAVYKLRKHVAQIDDGSDDDEIIGDDFESLYKGEISKSGIAILPSKRARKIPERIQVSEEDLKELTDSAKPDLDVNSKLEEDAKDAESVEDTEVSLNEISEKESQATEANSEDTDTSNN